MAAHPFDDTPLEQLRLRQSVKWRAYAPDVLPMWVAEMDYPLAEPIRQALEEALARSDTGYASPTACGDSFVQWAQSQWGWQLHPDDVQWVTDVVTGITELLRVATEPGERVVISPPVYPPFAGTLRSLGRTVTEAPLACDESGWHLDLGAIEEAYRQGARAHLVCSPENPTGVVHSAENLTAVAELAARYGVLLISDEIHAPLTLPGARHRPLPTVSEAAARNTIVLASASKAWNLAGLKAAMMIATRPETRAILAKLPPHTANHVGHFGVLGSRAAFGAGLPWLQQVHAVLHRNRQLLAELLREHLPEVRYCPPSAGYLAWLDFRALDLGDDPAALILQRQKVALSSGPTFGAQGKGFARLNFGTTREVLELGVQRMAMAVRQKRSS